MRHATLARVVTVGQALLKTMFMVLDLNGYRQLPCCLVFRGCRVLARTDAHHSQQPSNAEHHVVSGTPCDIVQNAMQAYTMQLCIKVTNQAM